MTHEPDIERVEFEDGWVETTGERVRGVFRIDPSSLPSIYAGSTPMHGLDNPSPGDIARTLCSTRFTYDGTQEDHGDVTA